MEPAFHGANVLGRAWRKATIMARWNKNNHDKHAPGASIDMKPLSWRKSWPLSISKSGSAGEPPAASARLARRWSWAIFAPQPGARIGGQGLLQQGLVAPAAERALGLADIAFAVGPGGYALIRADARHRGPQPCARPQAGGARCGWPGRAATGAAPLQSRAGCDVPSQGGGEELFLAHKYLDLLCSDEHTLHARSEHRPPARQSPKTQARS